MCAGLEEQQEVPQAVAHEPKQALYGSKSTACPRRAVEHRPNTVHEQPQLSPDAMSSD